MANLNALKEINIRRYEERDAAAVWDLHVSGLRAVGAYLENTNFDEDMKDIIAVYLNAGGEFLVAQTHSGELVGMGALRRVSCDRVELKRMRVHEQFRRKGLAQRIYDMLIARAKEMEYRTICLDTTTKQVAALNMYRKNGFIEIDRKQIGGLEVILFEKVLD